MTIASILATKGNKVVTIRPEQSIREALRVLAEHNIGALVVDRPQPTAGGNPLRARHRARGGARRGGLRPDGEPDHDPRRHRRARRATISRPWARR